MQGNAIHNGRHAEFAYAIIDVATELQMPVCAAAHCTGPFPVGKDRTGQVCRTTQHFGQYFDQGGNRKLRRLARRDSFSLVRGLLHKCREFVGEVSRHLAIHPARKFLCLLGIIYAVERKLLFPVALSLLATLALIPAGIYVFGNFKWRQCPADRLARSRDFCCAQR